MIISALNKLRGDPRAFLRKTFFAYLALTTGCTSTVQNLEQASAVEHSRNTAYSYNADSANKAGESSAAVAVQDSKNKYNLPELGGGAPKDEPPSRKSDDMGQYVGGMPLSAQQDVANPLNKGYDDAAAFQNMATSMLTSAGTDGIKQWFSARHATAELSMSTGKGGVKSGSFDLLMPIFDGEKDLVFTQVGFRRSNAMTEDYRTTVNLGIGYRRNFDNWLAGANAFYDRDITGKNSRFGIGAEAFTDNIKTSANIYVRATDWHKSPDLEDYLERPANGYDLRVEANLPSHPQLGGKLIYEQYFGDQVGLFGAGNRQKDPSAVTVGVTYSPVPMIGFGVDYRQGQGGMSDTSAKMTINYQFGVPLSKQLDLEYSKNHKLENSRYDLVNRRNDIVLDYREKDAGQIMLPAQISGTPSQTVSFPMTVTDHTISNFTWAGTAAPYAQPYGGGSTASLTMPAFQEGGVNSYSLQVIGSDRFGRVIQSNVMQVTVNAFMIALDRSKGAVMANGTDAVMFTATLQEPTGAAKPNTPVVWDVAGTATVTEKDTQTDSKGKARLTLTSRFASAVRVTVQEPQGAKAENGAAFAGDQRTAKVVGVVATPETLTANGSTTSTLTATVTDANGNSVGPGAAVTWTTSSGALSSASTVTNEDSTSTVTLTSAVAVGVAKITAKAVAGAANATVAFTADNTTARVLSVVATPVTIPANGAATSTLVATIEDANGNPVGANIPVSWTSTGGKLSVASSVTNADSKASVVLTSPVAAGSAQVTAKASAGAADATVTFSADNATAKVVELVATPASIPANNTATSSLVASVEDAHGNPVAAGVAVTFTTTSGTLSSASGVTDASGKATVTLKGTAAAAATVTAKATAGSATATVDLVPDNTTAKVVGVVATPDIIPANNTNTSTLVATVKDANSNPVKAGVSVAWTTTSGTLSGATSTTDASGKATITLKGTAAGTATVKAAAAAGFANATVTLVADNASAKVVELVATPTSIPANGTAITTLVATIEDANGNPVPAGIPVSWTTTNGALSNASTVTDAAGKTTVTLKGTVAGNASVKASAVAGFETADVSLFADNTTAKIVSLVATPASITANGTDSSTLVATLQDAHGNPVTAGASVAWTTNSGTLSGATSTTDASGKASVTLKGTVAGSASVKATAAVGSQIATVTLLADNATAKVVNLAATPLTITANGADNSVLVATVQDAHGNPVPAGVSVAWTTSSGALSGATSTTDASGKATISLKGTTAGAASVKASAAAGAATATVTLVADNASAKIVSLVATPASITANGTDSSVLVASVQDAHGNPVTAGVSVGWTTSSGTLSGATSTTDASGKASITLKGTVAGSASIKATATAGSATATVALVADNASARVIDLVATPSTITADGRDSSVLVATLQDAHGNPIGAGVSVGWTTSGGALSGATSTTDVSGKANITLKGTVAGSASVKATAAAGSATADITLVADSSTSKVVGLVASPATLAANGSDTSTLTATVNDANGNAVPGATVTWSTDNGRLSGSTSKTAANGKASITLTSPVAIGDATVKASAVAGSSSVGLRFIADSATSQVVSVKATPTTILANGVASSTLVASVEDAQGNPMGAGVSVGWSSTDGSLSSASTATDSRGKATVTFKGTKAETVTITATGAVGASGSASAAVALTADASTAKVASVVATPATIAANGTSTSTLVATLKDANNNDLGAGLTVSWSTDSGSLSSSSSVTDTNGRATVSLKGTIAGSATVTAKATAGTGTAVVNLVPDTATAKVVSVVATPSSITANGTATSTLVATVKDANHNTMGAGVTVNWGTTSGMLSGASSSTNSSGQATITLKGTVAGSATVTASAVAGSSNATVVLISDASTAKVVSLVATPTTLKADGSDTSTFVATLKDANNNDLGAGITVKWSTTSGVISAATTVTNSDGQTTVTLKNTVATPTNVTATAVGGSAITGVTFVADASTAKVTSVVATPTSITANGTAISTLVATVKDANGNTMFAGVTVNWGTSSGTLSGSSSVTNTSGQATITLKGTAAGSANVTATAAAGSANATVNLIADTATAKVVSLVATPDTITANGGAVSNLVATVKDANGNDLGAGLTVNWSTTSGNLTGVSSVTDSSGNAVMTFRGTAAGIATVKATATAGAMTTPVTLVADASTAKVTSLVATPTAIYANGSDVTTLVASLKDASGNKLGAGNTVNWATSLGALSAASSTTNANGDAVVTLKGTVAGSAVVTASAVGGSANVGVALVPDTATAKVVSVVATPTSITANGTAVSTLVATVKDANGNTMGAGVNVSWGTSGGVLSAASTATNASGQTAVTLKGTAAGSATVTASAVAGSSNAVVAMVADASTAKVTSLSATPTAIYANGSDATTLVASVKDASGNKLGAGITVTWATSLGALSAASSITNANGDAAVTLKGTVAGSAVVTASAVGGSANVGVALVPDTATAKVVSVVATPTSIPGNNSTVSTLVATLKDANGNAMGAGTPVSWGTTRGTLSAANTVTDANGQTAVNLRGTTAGPAVVTASAVAGAANATVMITADLASARITDLTASQTSIPTDGGTPSTILAYIRDASGNNVGAGVVVSFTTSAGMLSAASATTDASGIAVVNLYATRVGSGTVTASVPANSAAVTVGFYVDAASARVVSIVASPASVAADGTPSTLSATVTDANGNVVPGAAVRWATTINTLSAASSTTNASGVAVVNLSGATAGTATVTAQTTVSSNASAAVVFEATAPVVSSFTVQCTGQGANTICIDGSANLFDRGNAVFSWAAVQATRYELYSGSGALMYSGSGTSFDAYRQPNSGSISPSGTFTLKAYNGSAVTIRQVTPRVVDTTQVGPSG